MMLIPAGITVARLFLPRHVKSSYFYNMANPNLHSAKEPLTAADKEFENNIRPAAIADFSGQPQLIENLLVFIKATKMRGEALDHVLFHGPPGLASQTSPAHDRSGHRHRIRA